VLCLVSYSPVGSGASCLQEQDRRTNGSNRGSGMWAIFAGEAALGDQYKESRRRKPMRCVAESSLIAVVFRTFALTSWVNLVNYSSPPKAFG
jgi:hypothetical protein